MSQCTADNRRSLLSQPKYAGAIGEAMEFTATHLVVLVTGAGLGAGVVWLLTRTKTELAYAAGRSEGEVERTSLSAQLTAANQKTTESASVLAEAERERRLLHGALEEVRTE